MKDGRIHLDEQVPRLNCLLRIAYNHRHAFMLMTEVTTASRHGSVSIYQYASITRIKNRDNTSRFLDCIHGSDAYDLRTLFFSSASVTSVLRASCFIRRICLRFPWEGRLVFFFSGVVSIVLLLL